MTLWKLGCRWGSGKPLFYNFIKEKGIVIGSNDKKYSIDDWLLITDGFTILALAQVKSKRDCVENHPGLKQNFSDLEIAYNKNIDVYQADFIELKENERFLYENQVGICRVGATATIKKFQSILEKYKTTLMNSSNISLLQYKKQIILQGPPGTGKTKLAKELAELVITSQAAIDIDYFKNVVSALKTFKSAINQNPITIDFVKNDEIHFEGIASVGKYSFSITDLYNCYLSKDYLAADFVKYPHYAKRSLARYIADLYTNTLLKNQCKLVQFHPSYTYEDFVRGIVAKPNPDGDGIIYEAENKTLGAFAKEALKNYLDSKKDKTEVTKEHLLDDYFKQFVEYIMDFLEENDYRYPLTDNVCILNTDEDAFRYKGGTGWSDKGNRMLFKDIKQAYLDDNTIRQDLKKNENLSGLAFHHASYFVRVLNLFQDYLKENNLSLNVSNPEEVAEKNYVLIIDEINRANLSSVLGELIYALEYRDETVESMYAVDESNQLILPPNLYIIGTMNTADRSVGHIDYAIRRRFAFVDVLPQDLSADLGDGFDKPLFKKISDLFIANYDGYYNSNELPKRAKTLSQEFRPEDVWIGHSYFIEKKDEGGDMVTRLKYEIKPILIEYVKDGILIGTVKIGNEELTIEDYVKSL